MRIFASLLLALALGACATQPEIRGAELDALAEELIQFAADHSDLEPLPPPRIEFVEDVRVAFKGRYQAIDLYEDTDQLVGGYELANGTIWLQSTWRPTTAEKAMLLHELVHYLQHVQGRTLCRELLEREAYSIERQWLNEQGFGLPSDWAEGVTPSGCE